MADLGRKPWTGYEDGPMPIEMVAVRLRLNPRTVMDDLISAMRKIYALPSGPSIIHALHIMHDDPRSVPACGSVECLPKCSQEGE